MEGWIGTKQEICGAEELLFAGDKEQLEVLCTAGCDPISV